MSGKVRLGIVGCGGIASAHAEALVKIPSVEFVAFCDIVREKAEDFARRYGMGKAQVFTDAALMFESVKLDAVYFCLPPFAHGAEMYAVEYEVPFFVEKPIDLYLDRAEKIAEAVERKGLMTSVGYMNRYRKGVNIVRELLREDPPILVLGGWIGETPKVETWFIVKEKSGGQFHEQVTHTVDLVRFLCGEILEVYALPAKGLNRYAPPGYNIEDASVVNFKLANGAVGSLWASISANAGGGDVSLSIYANQTTALFTGWEHSLRLLRMGYKPEEVPGEPDIFSIEDYAFIEAVQKNDPSKIKCSYADGLKTLRVTLAANKSMETGKPVKL